MKKTATRTGEWTKGKGSEWLLDKAIMCPCCGHVMNGAGSPTGTDMPGPGMFALCIRCAAVSQYTETMQLRRVLAEEMNQDWPADFRNKVNRLRAAIQLAQMQRLMDGGDKPDPILQAGRA